MRRKVSLLDDMRISCGYLIRNKTIVSVATVG